LDPVQIRTIATQILYDRHINDLGEFMTSLKLSEAGKSNIYASTGFSDSTFLNQILGLYEELSLNNPSNKRQTMKAEFNLNYADSTRFIEYMESLYFEAKSK
jgi:hypothetical protein